MLPVDGFGYCRCCRRVSAVALPNRSTEFLDAVANMLRLAIGLALPVLILYLIWNRNHNLIKLLTMYSVVLIPLMIGLLYFNEITFITLDKPVPQPFRTLIALMCGP